jgi:hypothetical protein
LTASGSVQPGFAQLNTPSAKALEKASFVKRFMSLILKFLISTSNVQ